MNYTNYACAIGAGNSPLGEEGLEAFRELLEKTAREVKG